jgi:hypothetical protein
MMQTKVRTCSQVEKVLTELAHRYGVADALQPGHSGHVRLRLEPWMDFSVTFHGEEKVWFAYHTESGGRELHDPAVYLLRTPAGWEPEGIFQMLGGYRPVDDSEDLQEFAEEFATLIRDRYLKDLQPEVFEARAIDMPVYVPLTEPATFAIKERVPPPRHQIVAEAEGRMHLPGKDPELARWFLVYKPWDEVTKEEPTYILFVPRGCGGGQEARAIWAPGLFNRMHGRSVVGCEDPRRTEFLSAAEAKQALCHCAEYFLLHNEKVPGMFQFRYTLAQG